MTEISWEKELENSKFYDLRIKKRLFNFINSLSENVRSSIPFACQDWANTKGAYGFYQVRHSLKLKSCMAI